MAEILPKRHPIHWHEDGSITFQVEDELYCIHRSILKQLSPVFHEILSIPAGPINEFNAEGSEANPIVLAQVKKEEFDDFLLWIYRTNWTPPPHPERVYVHLLKMSQMWQIDEGIAFAVHHLEQSVLPPTRQLELARMFSIHDWVKPAMKTLIEGDLSSLSDEDAAQLGLKVYTILAKAKEAMEHERKLTSAYPPPMTFAESWECEKHERCRTVWREIWWKKIARQLLHPTKPLLFFETIGYISSTEHPGMTPSCKTTMLEKVMESGFKDVMIVDGAAEAVIKYHKSL